MRKALARIFAILAIAGCAVAIYSVVHSNLLKDDSKASETTSSTGHKPSSHSTHVTKHHHTTYVVKQGDVLTTIAVRHHTSVGQIEKLNPGLVASQIHTGQHIQLP